MVLFTKLQSNNLKNNILSNKLYVETLSFINQTKKHIKIDKDRLYAKVEKKILLLQNSLSFLCACNVLETKDKYAWE